MDLAEQFFTKGWVRVPYDPALAEWVRAVQPIAVELMNDADLKAAWLRCDGTWFAGVNILPNDRSGAISPQSVPALQGEAVDLAQEITGQGEISWDRAQISVCYPGYPRQADGESDAAFVFRRNRDAAHVDGVLPKLPGKRRALGEAHGFVLGVPLTETSAEAAPLVVYEGSHELMRAAFLERLEGIAPERWTDEDITDTYVGARRKAFETCQRVPVHARPGEAYMLHRLALHGMAPWGDNGGQDPRMIAYFRPELWPGTAPDWWIRQP